MANTTKQEKPDYDIDMIGLRLSVRWNTVLMPFEQSKFISLLPTEGYVLDQSLRTPPPFGTTLEAIGGIARKGSTTLSVDSNRLILGVEAADPETLVVEFEGLEELLRKRISFESAKHAHFHELLAQTLVWTDRSPMVTLRSLNFAGPLLTPLSQTIGLGPVSDISLRLIPAEGTPLSPDWWDFHIEPSFRSPERCFHVSIVYRSSHRDPVVQLARGIQDVIKKTIRLLERRDG